MAPVVVYRCPHCERVGDVPGEFAGKRARCPGCEGWLRVSRGHCRSSSDAQAGPAEQECQSDPLLGERVLEVQDVPLRVLDTLGVTLLLGVLVGLVGLLTESEPVAVLGTSLLALSALLWALIEQRAGRQGLLLHEDGLRLPSGVAVRWDEVLTLERGFLPQSRFTIHTIERDHRIGHGFCMRSDQHWVRLLWLPNRERQREELARKAARAIRLAEAAL